MEKGQKADFEIDAARSWHQSNVSMSQFHVVNQSNLANRVAVTMRSLLLFHSFKIQFSNTQQSNSNCFHIHHIAY